MVKRATLHIIGGYVGQETKSQGHVRLLYAPLVSDEFKDRMKDRMRSYEDVSMGIM